MEQRNTGENLKGACCNGINNIHYYMALPHKDWELPNSRI